MVMAHHIPRRYNEAMIERLKLCALGMFAWFEAHVVASMIAVRHQQVIGTLMLAASYRTLSNPCTLQCMVEKR